MESVKSKMRRDENTLDLDKARELVGNATLWPLVRDFLWDFAGQVHESWLAGIPGRETIDDRREDETVPSHVSCLMSAPRVKRYILDSLGVEPCFHDFPNDDGSRLLLLDGKTLEAVVRWLGALACAEELRHVTGGATVRALKAALPGVYPEVFGYTAYFRGDVFQRGDAGTQGLTDGVVTTGFEILLSAVADLPASLVSRLKLKLPKGSPFASHAQGLESDAKAGQETLDARRAKSTAAVMKLLKLKFPEAYSLCCS